MKVIKSNIILKQHQRDLISGVLSYPHSIHVCKSKRQVGKSVACEMLILKVAVDKPKSFSMYLSPTLKQSRKVFKEVKNAIEGSSVFFKANEALFEIILRNGSVIQFVSAEQKDNLRGYTISGMLVVDEAAFISDEIFDLILPTTDVHQAPILIVSTPLFRSGFFYDFYTDGLDAYNENVHSYDWAKYDMSDILSPERLEFYRQRLPKDKFTNEYLGLFTDLGTGIFGNVSDILNDDPDRVADCVMGVDFSSGTGHDDTSITIFNVKKQMVYIESFNDKDETETIDRIIELIKVFNPTKCTVELNSIGRIFYGLLQKKISQIRKVDIHGNGIKTTIHGFNTSNESKRKIVAQMQVAIQNKECTLLNNEKLLNQFSQFESKLTSAGNVTYAASGSSKDDMVMSTLIAYNSLSSGSYSIR